MSERLSPRPGGRNRGSLAGSSSSRAIGLEARRGGYFITTIRTEAERPAWVRRMT